MALIESNNRLFAEVQVPAGIECAIDGMRDRQTPSAPVAALRRLRHPSRILNANSAASRCSLQTLVHVQERTFQPAAAEIASLEAVALILCGCRGGRRDDEKNRRSNCQFHLGTFGLSQRREFNRVQRRRNEVVPRHRASYAAQPREKRPKLDEVRHAEHQEREPDHNERSKRWRWFSLRHAWSAIGLALAE